MGKIAELQEMIMGKIFPTSMEIPWLPGKIPIFCFRHKEPWCPSNTQVFQQHIRVTASNRLYWLFEVSCVINFPYGICFGLFGTSTIHCIHSCRVIFCTWICKSSLFFNPSDWVIDMLLTPYLSILVFWAWLISATLRFIKTTSKWKRPKNWRQPQKLRQHQNWVQPQDLRQPQEWRQPQK